jgi:hypothetical protein
MKTMALRRVNITRSANIADLRSLEKNRFVRKAWVMPWGFALLEIYDPIFGQLDDPSFRYDDPTRWNEEIRSYVRQIVDTERSILAPLYKGRPRHWQGNKLGLFLRSVTYKILDSKRLELPWLGQSTDWEIATAIRIGGKLREPASSKPVQDVLDRWLNWLPSVGKPPKMGDLRVNGKDFYVLCDFPERCGDACMALYTAFIAMPKDTSVEAAGFFSPDQTLLRYFRIGKPGEVTAQI